MMNKLEIMFDKQKELNDNTNGLGWEKGINKYDKEINWFRCINLEAAEAIESTPWKHWKNVAGVIDMENMHTELTDIWHFLMSQIISYGKISLKDVEKAFDINNIEACPSCKGDTKKIISVLEKLQFASLVDDIHLTDKINQLLKYFVLACYVCELSFDNLYKLYLAKNCLNQFRQDNGYKEGTYIKVWNGKEDNEVMHSIMENIKIEDLTFISFYSELEKVYKTLSK